MSDTGRSSPAAKAIIWEKTRYVPMKMAGNSMRPRVSVAMRALELNSPELNAADHTSPDSDFDIQPEGGRLEAVEGHGGQHQDDEHQDVSADVLPARQPHRPGPQVELALAAVGALPAGVAVDALVHERDAGGIAVRAVVVASHSRLDRGEPGQEAEHNGESLSVAEPNMPAEEEHPDPGYNGIGQDQQGDVNRVRGSWKGVLQPGKD